MNRRNFLEKAVRGILLGGLALVSGLLVSRKQLSRYTQCSAGLQCKNCDKISECQLPEAENQRKDG
ncbi:MAG: hypothetical protein P1P86_14195 [Bacteroidales bacterium]|nr:hypothetical protein [Bacteroidales bacterium]